MTTELESLLTEAARQAAIASWDAHGADMRPAETAYEDMRQKSWGNELPFPMPLLFRREYIRYYRLIAARHPSIVCDVTRPVPDGVRIIGV